MKLFRETVGFEMTGGAVERFLNIANRRGITVFNLKHRNDRVFAFTSAEEFGILRAAASKAGVCLEEVSHYGLTYRLRNYRGRIGFFVGFGVFCVTMWLLSLFVWSVETVNLPEEYAVSVTDVLYEAGLRSGVLSSSVDADMLEYELEERLPMFDMVKISCMGSWARVQFSLARPVRKQEEADWPCDLIASECGQIVSVTASKGTIFVKEGDVAAPGDVLVSGVFDGLESGSVNMVHASGTVAALVDRTFSENVSRRQIVKEPTGRIVNISRLMVSGIEIPLFSSPPKGLFRRTSGEYPLKVFGFALPVILRREQWHELCYTEKELSDEECVAQAEKILSAKIKRAECIDIVSSERTVNVTSTGVRVTRYVTLLKDISEERPLQRGYGGAGTESNSSVG